MGKSDTLPLILVGACFDLWSWAGDAEYHVQGGLGLYGCRAWCLNLVIFDGQCVCWVFCLEPHSKQPTVFIGDINAKGALSAIIAGVGVAGANIFLAHSYTAGGPASLVAILQNGFSISVTLLVGMLVLGEVIRPMQAIGIACAFIGIMMIAKG